MPPLLAQPTLTTPGVIELTRTATLRAGQLTTYVLIRPPRLPKAIPRPSPPAPTAEGLAWSERRSTKSYETVMLSADVYLGAQPLTLLRWREDDITHRAVSNLDFRLLASVAEVETNTAVFFWMPVVTAVEGEPGEKSARTAAQQLQYGSVDYALLDDTALAAPPRLLDLLDYLHAYAQLNGDKLARDLMRREAEELAAEEKRRRPPLRRDRTITYWLERGAKR